MSLGTMGQTASSSCEDDRMSSTQVVYASGIGPGDVGTLGVHTPAQALAAAAAVMGQAGESAPVIVQPTETQQFPA